MIIVSDIIYKCNANNAHIRCPKCHYRLCDSICNDGKSQIITTQKATKFDLSIKCHKCGVVVGLKIKK